jgi:hypothetical protein
VVEETGCKIKNIGVEIIQIGPSDQRFVKSQKIIGLRMHTLQIFDLLL